MALEKHEYVILIAGVIHGKYSIAGGAINPCRFCFATKLYRLHKLKPLNAGDVRADIE